MATTSRNIAAATSPDAEFDLSLLPENPYLLLTPGPLSTTAGVRAAMLRDWCTWDSDYLKLVEEIRHRLAELAAPSSSGEYTAVLMQGSGTFAVESVLTSVVPAEARLLVLANGAYGRRMTQIARVAGVPTMEADFGELYPVDPERVASLLKLYPGLTHVALVHCETTTGMLNPLEDVARVVKQYDRTLIVDAMSSLGGIPLDVKQLDIDFLVSSANKCIQGVPGFGVIVARTRVLESCKGIARSLSLDLHNQWEEMERGGGKWRFTSPTHAVHAFYRALLELDEEGGVPARWKRYRANQRALVAGMGELGFETLLPAELQSPIITSFRYPSSSSFSFGELYERLKARGFVIYPGKITACDTFRIGTIGDVHVRDVKRLLHAVKELL